MHEIAGALTALKGASELIKNIIGVRDALMTQEQVFDLQRHIIAAQTSAIEAQAAQTALQDEIRDLRAAISRLEAWNVDAERYSLYQHPSGGFTYKLKEGADRGEPVHHLCSTCFERKIKSVLHQAQRNPGRCTALECHSCGSAIYLIGDWREGHPPWMKARSG